MHVGRRASKQEFDAPAGLTLDGMADAVNALRERLAGSSAVPPAELRRLWKARQRPFWRLHVGLYRSVARRFLDQGENFLAITAAAEGSAFFPEDGPLLLTRALATARSGAPAAAQALLIRHEESLANTAETRSLLARTFKDLWKTLGDAKALQRAFELYAEDYARTTGDRTFPGVNAASMALLRGDLATARRIAGEVRDLLEAATGTPDYWRGVTLAECLLVGGYVTNARDAYARAAGARDVPLAHLATTRAQARLLLRALGRDEAEFDACFPLPDVLVFTGHRLDAPGRATPRFPADLAPAVKERIRDAIGRSGAGCGFAAAANGGDLLFLECLQEAGLETSIHLPLPEPEFVRASVADAPGWQDRFEAVKAGATEFAAAPFAGKESVWFDYGNRLLLGAARQRARQLGSTVRLLTLWNGAPGTPGDGGTGDCVRLARAAGIAVEVIPLEPFVAGPPLEKLSASPVGAGVLAILAFHVGDEDSAAARVARALADARTVHREVFGPRVRLLFATVAEAAAAARRLRTEAEADLISAIGLHAAPVRREPHPVTAAPEPRSPHLARADALAALSPIGALYASSAFVALAELEDGAALQAEFIGHRALDREHEDGVFRLPD